MAYDLTNRMPPATSSLDAEGRPICVWCRRRLRFHMGYGYNGTGHFCGMRSVPRNGRI